MVTFITIKDKIGLIGKSDYMTIINEFANA